MGDHRRRERMHRRHRRYCSRASNRAPDDSFARARATRQGPCRAVRSAGLVRRCRIPVRRGPFDASRAPGNLYAGHRMRRRGCRVSRGARRTQVRRAVAPSRHGTGVQSTRSARGRSRHSRYPVWFQSVQARSCSRSFRTANSCRVGVRRRAPFPGTPLRLRCRRAWHRLVLRCGHPRSSWHRHSPNAPRIDRYSTSQSPRTIPRCRRYSADSPRLFACLTRVR